MTLSILSHLLVTERERPRAARGVGLAIPAMMEREAPYENADPVLGSGSRGQFLVTPRTRDGVYRYALANCLVENEGAIFPQLHQTLWAEGERRGWSNRATSVLKGLQMMKAAQVTPKAVVISSNLVKTFCPPEYDVGEGRVTIVGGVSVMVTAHLPEGEAIIATAPPRVGVYTRMGDHLGLQLYSVSQTLVVVRDVGSGIRSMGD